MLALALFSVAHALPVDGGVQVALYETGGDFAEEILSAQAFDIEEPIVSGEAACYDAVGIENLNVHIPIQSADIRFSQDILSIDIFFDEIHGEDMVIFGQDDDWADACPSFELDFHSFQITNGRVHLALAPRIEDNAVQMEVASTPVISGEIQTDIDWVPDTLILSFIEDKIFEVLSEKIQEAVPGLVSEYVDTSLYADQIGDLALDVDLSDIEIGPHALMVGLNLDAEWRGESCLVTGAPESPEGRSPDIDFGTGDGSALGVGLTEHQINGLLLGAYSDGLLCFEHGPLSGALDALGDSIGAPIEDPELEVDFGGPPTLRLDEDRMRLRLDDFHLALTGTVDGVETEFLGLDANIEAAVEISVDQEISAIVLDLVYVDLDLKAFQADALLSDREGAEDRMVAFLEGWVMDVVADRVQNVALYSSLFHAMNYFIRLDAAGAINGGLLLRASLFDGDDPQVDTSPPQTQVRILSATDTELQAEWKGTDDKADALSYAWRIDGGEWSAWTAETWGILPAPAPGTHFLEVRSRDGWSNVDPTPALLAFEIVAPAEKDEGCMCASSRAPLGGLAWLVLPALWVRRRR